jgi:hypothetical protein
MKRKKLDKFDACYDCLKWKIVQFMAARKNAYRRFMQYEIKNLEK